MADTELPKPFLLEFDKAEFSPAKATPSAKTPVRERLENSPKKVLSPEILHDRQERAQKRRLLFEEEKVNKAHAVLEKVKEVRERTKNTPKDAQTDA